MKSFHRPGALLLGGMLAISAIAFTVLPRSQSIARSTVPTNLNRVSLTLPPQTSDGTEADSQSTANKLPLAFYQENVRTGLFTAPQPAPPAPPAHRVDVAKPVQKVEQTISLTPPPDRFANYVYSGSVEMNGQIVALIENSQTKEGWYLKAGDRFEGASVTRVDAQSVMLDVDGKPRLFDKSTVYNVVPLNAAARPDQLNANASVQTATVQTGGANQTASIQPNTGEANPAASAQPNTNNFGRRGFGGPGGFGGQGNFGGRGAGGQGNFGGPGGPPAGGGGPGGPPQ